MYKNGKYKTYTNVSYLYRRQEGRSKTINHENKWRFFSLYFLTIFSLRLRYYCIPCVINQCPSWLSLPSLPSLTVFLHFLASLTSSLPLLHFCLHLISSCTPSLESLITPSLSTPFLLLPFLSSSLTHFLSSSLTGTHFLSSSLNHFLSSSLPLPLFLTCSLPLPLFLFPLFLHSLSPRSPSPSFLSLVLHSFFINCFYLFIPLFLHFLMYLFCQLTYFVRPFNPRISCTVSYFFVLSSNVLLLLYFLLLFLRAFLFFFCITFPVLSTLNLTFLNYYLY
jgi:hypothetical protein